MPTPILPSPTIAYVDPKTGTPIRAFYDLLRFWYAAVKMSGVGYILGAGGAVTQQTSKSTGVTLNTPTGQITMNAAALAAATIVSFTLTNSAVEAADVLVLNHISGGTAGAYTLNAQCAAGSATINVRNATAGSLSEAVVIAFALLKGRTA